MLINTLTALEAQPRPSPRETIRLVTTLIRNEDAVPLLLENHEEQQLVYWILENGVQGPENALELGRLGLQCPDAARVADVLDWCFEFDPVLGTLVVLAADADDTDRGDHLMFDVFQMAEALLPRRFDGLVSSIISRHVALDLRADFQVVYGMWLQPEGRHWPMTKVLPAAELMAPSRIAETARHFLGDNTPATNLVQALAEALTSETALALTRIVELAAAVPNKADTWNLLSFVFGTNPDLVLVLSAAAGVAGDRIIADASALEKAGTRLADSGFTGIPELLAMAAAAVFE